MYEQSEASNFLLPKQLKSVRMKYLKSFSLLVGLTIATTSVVAQGLLVKGAYLKVKQNTLIKIKSGGFHNKTINNNLSNEGIIALDGLLQNLGSISGTILMNGTSNIDAYIGVLQNLEISTNGTVRAADHGSVSRLLKINSGATFDTNGKNIVLESDANQTALVHHKLRTCPVRFRHLFCRIHVLGKEMRGVHGQRSDFTANQLFYFIFFAFVFVAL